MVLCDEAYFDRLRETKAYNAHALVTCELEHVHDWVSCIPSNIVVGQE